MKNIEKWNPTKYEFYRGKLKGSRNRKEVALSSRLGIDLVAKFYQHEIPQHASGRLVDLGCGKVPLYHVYKDHVDEVICVDWANTFHKNSHLDIIQDLNEALQMEDQSCETIILSDVLEHIREPKFLMSEMNRILTGNGKVIMNVPFYYWLHEKPYDFYRYTRFALEYFAKETGFKVLKLEAYGGSLEIVADVLSKQMMIIPLVGKLMTWMLQVVSGFWISTGFGTKVAKKTSESFPLGYVLVLEKA